METRNRAKQNFKREHDDDGQNPRKIQRIVSSVKPVATTAKPMSVIGKNDDNRCFKKPSEFPKRASAHNDSAKNQVSAGSLNYIDQFNDSGFGMFADQPEISIETVLNMIKGPSVIKLVLPWYSDKPVNSTEVRRFVKEHPKMIEIDLSGYQFTADNLIAMIYQMNSLKAFKYQMLRSEYTKLKTQLIGDEWKIHSSWSCDNNHVIVGLKH